MGFERAPHRTKKEIEEAKKQEEARKAQFVVKKTATLLKKPVELNKPVESNAEPAGAEHISDNNEVSLASGSDGLKAFEGAVQDKMHSVDARQAFAAQFKELDKAASSPTITIDLSQDTRYMGNRRKTLTDKKSAREDFDKLFEPPVGH